METFQKMTRNIVFLAALTIIGAVIMFPIHHVKAAVTFTLASTTLEQGDVGIVFGPANATSSKAKFGVQNVVFFPYTTGTRGLFSVTPDAKVGTSSLTIFYNNSTTTFPITIKARVFKIIELPLPPKLNTTPAKLNTFLATSNATLATAFIPKTATSSIVKPFMLPMATSSYRLGSPYGETRKTGPAVTHHWGSDFAAKTGTPIYAVNDGKVDRVGYDKSYGIFAIIDHGYGIYSMYMHMSYINARLGTVIKQGALVGQVGETGYATGPHLHLTMKVNNVSIDPMRFIKGFK